MQITEDKPSNRNYRDSIFVDLFSKDRDAKANFLSLYNAIHGTNLTLDKTVIEPVQLEQVLYMGYYNDVSMLIDGKVVVLCEHQSTPNANMPLRCLLYIAKTYEKLAPNNVRFKKEVYALPEPEFYVFYNGKADLPAYSELRLSEAFFRHPLSVPNGNPPLELVVPVYNISKHTENSVIDRRPSLKEYAEFVKIVERTRTEDKQGFMPRAIRRAVKAGVLAEYLTRKNKEVENMYWGEYDYETDVAVQREEAYEQGIEQGISQGARDARLEIARNCMRMGIPLEQVAQVAGISREEILSLQDTLD